MVQILNRNQSISTDRERLNYLEVQTYISGLTNSLLSDN